MTRRRLERGSILVTSVFALLVLLAFGFLVMDVGMAYAVKSTLQTPAQAAALAAGRKLPGDPAAARLEALRFAHYNGVRGRAKLGVSLTTAVYNAGTPDTKTKAYDAMVDSTPEPFDSRTYVEVGVEEFSAAQLDVLLGTDWRTIWTSANPRDVLADSWSATGRNEFVVVTPFSSPRLDELRVDDTAAVCVAISQKSLNAVGVFFGPPYRDVGAFAVAVAPNSIDPVTNAWTLGTFGHLHGTPYMANDILYIGEATDDANAGRVLAIKPATGELYWTMHLSDPNVVTDGANGNATQRRYRLTGDPATQTIYDTDVYATSAFRGHGKGPHGVQTSPTVFSLSYPSETLAVVAGHTNGWLYAMRADTGDPFWSVKIDFGQEAGLWTNSSPFAYKDQIYIGTLHDSVASYDRDNGTRTSRYATGGFDVLSDPIVVYLGSIDQTVLIFGDNDGRVRAIPLDFSMPAPNNGELSATPLWTFTTTAGTGDVTGGFRYFYDRTNGREMLLFGADNNVLYCLNAATGAAYWQYNVGRDPTLYRQFHNKPTVEVLPDSTGTRVIHVGDGSGWAIALKENNAGTAVSLLWQTRVAPDVVRIESTPAVRNGLVYYGARTRTTGIPTDAGDATGGKGGRFMVLNAETGEVVQTYPIGNDTHSSLLIDDNRIYYAACDNQFHGDEVNSLASSNLFNAYLLQ